MRNRGKRAGFFTVEVVAAMVTAAVLAVTGGAMLFHGYAGWRKNTTSIEMQRDGTLAMDMLSRAIRAATETNVTVAASELRVATPGGTVAFTTSGSDLLYDPDTGIPGDETTVVAGRLLSFTPALLTNTGVSVDLQLEEGDDSTHLTALLGFRN
jgi:hypothetical protein